MQIPIIYPLDQSLDKAWFVKYPNPNGGAPLKKYGKLASCNTLQEKMTEANRIITEELGHITISTLAKNTPQVLYDIQTFFGYICIGLKPKSIGTYSTVIDEFAKWYRTYWRQNEPELIGFEFIRYLADKGLSNTTLNKYRSFMRTVFTRLVDAKKFPVNPFAITKKLTERRQTKDWFRVEQIAQVKAEIQKRNPQLWLGCMLQFYCFIRPNSELPMLKIRDIEIANRRIRIDVNVGKKARTDEFIPIPDDMLAEMDRLTLYPGHYFIFSHNGKPGINKLGRDTMSKRHKAIMKELKYPKNYTYYSWKNSGAVHMLNAGINVVQISKLMRHKSLDYTREYFKSLGFDDMAEDLNKKYPKI